MQTIINGLISNRDNYRAEARERAYREEAEYSEALRKCKIAILYNNLVTLDQFSEHFLALTSSFEEIERASKEIIDFLNENNTPSLEMFHVGNDRRDRAGDRLDSGHFLPENAAARCQRYCFYADSAEFLYQSPEG